MEAAFHVYAFANPAFQPLVRSAWGQSHGAAAADLPGLIAPDAQVEIVFQLGAPCDLAVDGRTLRSPAAMVYGLRHGLVRLQPTGPGRMVALRLTAPVASVLLGSSIDACWDRPVPLDTFIGREADQLLDALFEALLEDAGGLLEAWLTRGLVDWGSDHDRQLALHAALFGGSPSRSISALADDLGLTVRTLRRRCATYIGLSPKQMAMSGRMLRACGLLRGKLPLAEVADMLGFSDQLALTNTSRHYFGMTPGRLRAEPLVFHETP